MIFFFETQGPIDGSNDFIDEEFRGPLGPSASATGPGKSNSWELLAVNWGRNYFQAHISLFFRPNGDFIGKNCEHQCCTGSS